MSSESAGQLQLQEQQQQHEQSTSGALESGTSSTISTPISSATTSPVKVPQLTPIKTRRQRSSSDASQQQTRSPPRTRSRDSSPENLTALTPTKSTTEKRTAPVSIKRTSPKIDIPKKETPRPVLMNFIKMAKAKFLAAHDRTEESLKDDDQDLIIQQAQTDYDDACDAWKQSHAPSSAGSSGGSGQSPIQPSKPMKFYLTEGQKYLEFYRAHTRWHEDTDGDKSNFEELFEDQTNFPEPTEEDNMSLTSVYSSAPSSNRCVSSERLRFNEALSRLCPHMKSEKVAHNSVGKGGIVNLRWWKGAKNIPIRVLEAIQVRLCQEDGLLINLKWLAYQLMKRRNRVGQLRGTGGRSPEEEDSSEEEATVKGKSKRRKRSPTPEPPTPKKQRAASSRRRKSPSRSPSPSKAAYGAPTKEGMETMFGKAKLQPKGRKVTAAEATQEEELPASAPLKPKRKASEPKSSPSKKPKSSPSKKSKSSPSKKSKSSPAKGKTKDDDDEEEDEEVAAAKPVKSTSSIETRGSSKAQITCKLYMQSVKAFADDTVRMHQDSVKKQHEYRLILVGGSCHGALVFMPSEKGEFASIRATILALPTDNVILDWSKERTGLGPLKHTMVAPEGKLGDRSTFKVPKSCLLVSLCPAYPTGSKIGDCHKATASIWMHKPASSILMSPGLHGNSPTAGTDYTFTPERYYREITLKVLSDWHFSPGPKKEGHFWGHAPPSILAMVKVADCVLPSFVNTEDLTLSKEWEPVMDAKAEKDHLEKIQKLRMPDSDEE